MSRRTEQVNDLIREELAELVREEINDPRMHGLGDDHARRCVAGPAAGARVRQRARYGRRPHARRWRRSRRPVRISAASWGSASACRYMPNLRFVSDTSMEEAQEMTDLLRETAAERGETLPAPRRSPSAWHGSRARSHPARVGARRRARRVGSRAVGRRQGRAACATGSSRRARSRRWSASSSGTPPNRMPTSSSSSSRPTAASVGDIDLFHIEDRNRCAMVGLGIWRAEDRGKGYGLDALHTVCAGHSTT